MLHLRKCPDNLLRIGFVLPIVCDPYQNSATGLEHRPHDPHHIGCALLLIIQEELTSPPNATRTPLIWMLSMNTPPDLMPLIHTYTSSPFNWYHKTKNSPLCYHPATSPPAVSHPSENRPTPASTSPSHSASPAPVSSMSSFPQLALTSSSFLGPLYSWPSHLILSERYPSRLYPIYGTIRSVCTSSPRCAVSIHH